MIYLVVENYYDGDSSWNAIIFATSNKKLAETAKEENIKEHNKEREKINKINESLQDKCFEDFTEEDHRLYKELVDFQDHCWTSTDIKEVDIDTDINVYI